MVTREPLVLSSILLLPSIFFITPPQPSWSPLFSLSPSPFPPLLLPPSLYLCLSPFLSFTHISRKHFTSPLAQCSSPPCLTWAQRIRTQGDERNTLKSSFLLCSTSFSFPHQPGRKGRFSLLLSMSSPNPRLQPRGLATMAEGASSLFMGAHQWPETYKHIGY